MVYVHFLHYEHTTFFEINKCIMGRYFHPLVLGVIVDFCLKQLSL